MKVLRAIPQLAAVPGPVVLAVGVFDGLHRGHRAVLERAQTEAAALGGAATAVSFEPHPATVLRPDQAPALLTPPSLKLKMLERMGLQYALILPFDAKFAATEADAFIRTLAASCRPLAAICVGQNWSFGKGRSGNLSQLTRLGEELLFSARGVEELTLDGEPISSTRIRSALTSGDFSLVERLLGRPFSLAGLVQHGRALGRTLGFPTANIPLGGEQIPPLGVYAVRVRRDGHPPHPGVANLGVRPTLDSPAHIPVLEVHLLHFNAPLYGEFLEVEFLHFLRPEQRFASLAALREQIARDAEQARTILGC